MNSISLKEAAALRGVSERRISQLANESGSGVWRVERGRYSFEQPQKVNHIRKADEVLYQARWLSKKGETEEAENIWESFLKDEIHNPQRSAGEKAVALLNLIWFEDTQLREKSGIPQQPFAELFKESKLGDTFSQEQCDYLVNHSHFDLGMITPDDHAELTSQIRSKFDVLMELNSQKKRLPEITNLDWHLIVIEILKNVMLSRKEREGKPRIDYIGLAIEIVNDLRESN